MTEPPAQDAQAQGVEARFHDGQVARPYPVSLQIGPDGVAITGEYIWRQYGWKRTRVSERLQHASRLITFDDGCFCEVSDHAALDAALQAAGHRESWVSSTQQMWSRVWVALALLVVAIGVLYRWGLPLAADQIARRIPISAEQALGVKAVEFFENQILKPSTLPAQRQQQLQQEFGLLVPRGDRRYRLALHDGGSIGANALALPGGTIVVTDQLVALAPNDDALAGVMAHEIGHVENRHVMRQMVSATVIGLVATLIAGDTSGLMAGLPATLANLSYSRDMERQADRYAIDELKRRHIPLHSFAALLQALQDQRGHGGSTGSVPYLSTHPDTAERIAQIRAAAAP